MNADSQSILVNLPAAELYRRCLRFEDFPDFLPFMKKVHRTNETGFTCTSLVFGQEIKSFVAIIMCIPNRRIAWQSVSDYFRVGVVLFESLSDGSTEVTVRVRSITEPVKLHGALRGCLQNFKRFVEEEASAPAGTARRTASLARNPMWR